VCVCVCVCVWRRARGWRGVTRATIITATESQSPQRVHADGGGVCLPGHIPRVLAHEHTVHRDCKRPHVLSSRHLVHSLFFSVGVCQQCRPQCFFFFTQLGRHVPKSASRPTDSCAAVLGRKPANNQCDQYATVSQLAIEVASCRSPRTKVME
jgi:hypothetical protein